VPTSIRKGVKHINFNIAIHVEGRQRHGEVDFVTVARMRRAS
jgi:hypothetical protein